MKEKLSYWSDLSDQQDGTKALLLRALLLVIGRETYFTSKYAKEQILINKNQLHLFEFFPFILFQVTHLQEKITPLKWLTYSYIY